MIDRSTADKAVFLDDYTPGKVVDRAEEKKALRESIQEFRSHGTARGVYLHGSSGLGKTETVRTVLEDIDLPTAEVNCFKHETVHEVLYRILRSFGVKLQIHKSTPTGELRRKLQAKLRSQKAVVFLDELDKLEERKAFYTLNEMPNLQVVAASNSPPTGVFKDERNTSRLQSYRFIQFQEYSNEDLEKILKERCREAGVSSPAPFVSTVAEHPSVDTPRQGLGVILNVLEHSDSALSEGVDNSVLENSLNSASQASERVRDMELNDDQKLLLRIVEESVDGIEPGDLYEQYKKRARNPKVERTLRKYLNKMQRHNLIEARGQGRWRVYAPADGDVVEEMEEPAVA